MRVDVPVCEWDLVLTHLKLQKDQKKLGHIASELGDSHHGAMLINIVENDVVDGAMVSPREVAHPHLSTISSAQYRRRKAFFVLAL